VVAGDPASVERLPGVHDLVTTPADGGTRVTFDVDNARIGAVLSAVAALDVHSLTATPPSLEELFMRHYGDAPAGAR
jgi:ABC-2 type transport system ATP-binding protein